MTAPDRTALVRLIRAELAIATDDLRVFTSLRHGQDLSHGIGDPLYPLALLLEQFNLAREATWIDHARRLRDLLAEMGEQP